MADEVVAGATKKQLVVVIVDDNNEPIDLTGGSVSLQGKSSDLPEANIDEPGVLTDPAQGVATWNALGTLVAPGDLSDAGLTEALYALRVKYTDVGGLFDYGPKFELKWVEPPIPPV